MSEHDVITSEQLVARVRELGPFENAAESHCSLAATLEVLGERLMDEEVAMLGQELAPTLAARLRTRPYGGDFSLAQFYERIARREHVRLGLSVEHAQVVCRALSELLTPTTLQHLRRHVPELSELLHVPEPPRVPDARPVPRASARAPHTLAEGRPGGSEPLASASHDQIVHTHSIARSDDPHAETKLSSSRGLTQERLRRTLAAGRPGSNRPLSGR